MKCDRQSSVSSRQSRVCVAAQLTNVDEVFKVEEDVRAARSDNASQHGGDVAGWCIHNIPKRAPKFEDDLPLSFASREFVAKFG